MSSRILLSILSAAVVAACVVVTEPGPAVPEPAPVAPGEPAPEPVSPEPVEGEPGPEPAPAPVDDWKACHEAEDCVPVGCGCSCSGCGGFSHDDIVNKDFEQAWYDEKGCQKAQVCPQVCCPAMSVVCQDGQCAVVAGEKLNVH